MVQNSVLMFILGFTLEIARPDTNRCFLVAVPAKARQDQNAGYYAEDLAGFLTKSVPPTTTNINSAALNQMRYRRVFFLTTLLALCSLSV